MSSFGMFWFMYDIDNYVMITSRHIIPGDIDDSKEIVLTETPVPGLNFRPIQYGGGGNRHLSFIIPVIQRNGNRGNSELLKQFDGLRNQATGVTSVFSGQFTPTPRVLFQYGTGSVPLIYWVFKCKFNHKSGWTNAAGYPQYTDVEIELVLDETSPLYKMEEVARKAAGIAGQVTSFIPGRKPV